MRKQQKGKGNKTMNDDNGIFALWGVFMLWLIILLLIGVL